MRPAVHGPATTVGELRTFFHDDHVHMALLVDRGKLVGTVERADIAAAPSDDTPASSVARLDGRTIGPEVALPEALDTMKRDARRRLAVIDADSTLLGLLCLKARGDGFCSD